MTEYVLFCHQTWQSYRQGVTSESLAYIATRLACIANDWTDGLNNKTYEGILNCTKNLKIAGIDIHNRNSESMYIALWKFLHNEVTYNENEEESKLLLQLANAPCEGTYKYSENLFSDNGWASSMKFDFPLFEQIYGQSVDFYGNYSGLDYLLMYNLYLISYSHGYYFTNYLNRNISGYCPIIQYVTITNPTTHQTSTFSHEAGSDNYPGNVNAFVTIKSSQQIKNTSTIIYSNEYGTHNITEGPPLNGNMTYKAEKSINLLPGFRVEEGAFFHAKINKIDCDLSPVSLTSSNLYVSQIWDIGYVIPPLEHFVERINIQNEYISNLQNGSIIFPNPFDECIYLSNILSDNYKYEVLDINTRVVEEGYVTPLLCFKEIPSGIYLLRIYSNNNYETYKII